MTVQTDAGAVAPHLVVVADDGVCYVALVLGGNGGEPLFTVELDLSGTRAGRLVGRVQAQRRRRRYSDPSIGYTGGTP